MTDYTDLQELRAMPSGLERVARAASCIADHEEAVRAARRIRDEEIRKLAAEWGPARTSRETGIPLPTVKIINRGN